MELIAKALGVSKPMIFKYVKNHQLRKNKQNKIDIEDSRNREFLESKICDFSIFYGENIPEGVKSYDKSERIKPEKIEKPVKIVEKPQKVIQKPVEMPLKPEKTEQDKPKKKTNDNEKSLYELEYELKTENVKAKQLDSMIKKIKIEEANARLIPRDFTERLINDTVGAIQQTFLVIPSSIIDILFNIYENHPEDRREQIIKLLQEKYTKETKKTVQKAYDRFRKAIKEQIEKADEKPES